MSKFNILFQLTGSISCFKAAQAISTLVQRGHNVKCVASQNALRFVGVATLEGLTGSPVFADSYEPGRMMDHIELARWADIFVLCPATANTINRLAHGIADDVIGQLFLAKEKNKSYFIFPAMNHEMYTHPATQEAFKKLEDFQAKVLPTGLGHQACGENGEGRLLEPSEIVRLIEGPVNPLNVLVTGGATREKIDDVRFISNMSTGKTASKISDYLLAEGHKVSYVAGPEAVLPKHQCKILNFTDFDSLYNLLKNELTKTHYDIIIHSAAVSDFSVLKITSDGKALKKNSKISSDHSELSLELKKNKKIVSEIAKWSPRSKLVAFKLTSGATPVEIKAAVEKLIDQSKPYLVVHNDFSQMNIKDERVFSVYSGKKSNEPLEKVNSLKALTQLLIERSHPNDHSP